MKYLVFFYVPGMVILFHSCAPRAQSRTTHYPAIQYNPDYNNLDYWAAHPGKKDPSDSIAKPLEANYKFDSSIDVFFLHPTTLTHRDDTSNNASLGNIALNVKTDQTTILFQASVFNEYRVYAPRYRQAHIRSYFPKDAKDSALARHAFAFAYEDVKKAFQYYLENENKGRPFIIASHSQGTTHAMQLMKEYAESKPLQNQLVAAYLVGMYIPGNYFSTITLCEDSLQTNCVCTWRTFKKGYQPDWVKKENGSSWVINPITWNKSGAPATASMHKGALLRNFNKLYYKAADAQIRDGVIWTMKPRFPGSFLLRMKNYHIGDINLYYLDIRNNLRQRVTAFKQLHPLVQ